LAPKASAHKGIRRTAPGRFHLIDWDSSPGPAGKPFFDLFLVAHAFNLARLTLRREVRRHSAILGCAPQDAQAYVLAALGWRRLHLDQFPLEAYARVARRLLERLEI
jgi:hypothetical protein